MSDRVFLDSNILVYAHTDFDSKKQLIAQTLIKDNFSFKSTQVLQETANILSKKFKVSWSDIANVLANSKTNNILHINAENSILQACRIAERYGFSFYDSLIISASLECNAIILYSEDLHNNQIIDEKLKIVNPFALL